MRITKISVTGLFGQYDHTIPLNQEDHITIIHGPNGVGKTILLRMIQGLFSANFGVFRDVPFQGFGVDFDDGRYLVIHPRQVRAPGRVVDDLALPGEKSVTVRVGDGTQEYDSPSYGQEDPSVVSARKEINRWLPELELVNGGKWIDPSTGKWLTVEGVWELYAPRLKDNLLRACPKWLTDMLESAPTMMLRTDRLDVATIPRQPDAEPHSRPDWLKVRTAPLQYISDQLIVDMYDADESAAKTVAERDRTFPARLIDRLESAEMPPPGANEIRLQLDELEARRTELSDAGLIDLPMQEERVLIPDQAVMDETTRAVLSLYLEDSWAKLTDLEPLFAKVELLTRIIDSRLAASSKHLEISAVDGLLVHTPGGRSVQPEALSSGEKQQLMLFYHLIFSTKPGTLVLIDEPELSMHIAWQQKFLKDLGAVAKMVGLDFLIATHSPDIIYDRWDLTVDLGGGGADVDGH